MSAPPDRDAPWGRYRLRGWKRAWLKGLHLVPALPGLRRPALWLRKALKEALEGPVDAEVWGLRLRLEPQRNLSESRMLMMPQFADRKEREFVAEAFRDGRGLLVDIGANAGLHTLWAASLGPGVRVEAFEPDPSLCRRLRANLDRNGLEQVRLHPVALGGASTQGYLLRHQANQGQNRLTGAPGPQALPVPVRTLQEALEEGGVRQVDVLKIDVEGHEAEILSPFFGKAPESLWPRAVLCEEPRPPRVSEVSKLIVASGYARVARTRMNGIYLRKR